MKRTASCFLISLTAILLFTGCAAQALENTLSDQNEVSVTLPEDKDVNGYRSQTTESFSAEDQTEQQITTRKAVPEKSEQAAASAPYAGLYYANTKTKKFHCADCGYATRISEENLYITDDRQELMDQGYEPCSQCQP